MAEVLQSCFLSSLDGAQMPPEMRTFSSLTEILDEAAAGRDLRRYLDGRGVKTIGTLALMAADEDSLQKSLIDPLWAGYGTGSDRINIPEDEKPIARAVLLHTWSLARTTWSRYMTPAAPPAAPATSTTSSTSGAAAADHKVPKCLPPGKWFGR